MQNYLFTQDHTIAIFYDNLPVFGALLGAKILIIWYFVSVSFNYVNTKNLS